MLKKTVLALATTATLGLSTLAMVTPAEAGFWIAGRYVDRDRGWERHRCHMEVRKVQVWRHGHARWEDREVRVCESRN